MPGTQVIKKSEVETDPAVVSAAAEEADFESGYTGKPVDTVIPKEGAAEIVAPKGGQPASGAAPSQQQPAAGAAPNPVAGAAPKKEPPNPQNQVNPEDEVVKIDKKTLDRILYAADLAVSLKGNVDKLNGTVGSQVAQIKALINPNIEISDKDFEELARDFPDIAKATKSGLKEVLKRLGKVAQPGLSVADLQAEVTKRTIQLEDEALSDSYSNWREIVGVPTDKNNEFRKWLDTQPAAYRERVTNTFSSQIIARAIQRFMASKKPATPPTPKPAATAPGARGTVRTAARQDRLRSAVTPRGDGGATPSRQPSEDDEFASGFKQG